jgi:hypothetical protein
MRGLNSGRQTMTKKQRAVQLRDLALKAIKTGGASPSSHGPQGGKDLHIQYRTPLYPLQPWPTRSRNLPYGLDIWCNNKVLNIEWSDDGRIEVVSYRPGEWERDLERAASQDTLCFSNAGLGLG